MADTIVWGAIVITGIIGYSIYKIIELQGGC